MLRVIDLFCGVGGFGLGARAAGMDLSLSVDVDPILTSSHGLNFRGSQLLLSNLRDVSGRQLRLAAGGDIDIVVGGPPCQGFSTIGKGRIDDPRRDLLGEFFRLVRELEPAFFLMENVVGLVSPKNRPILDTCLDSVNFNYDFQGPTIIDAVDLGAPTRRRRVFVVGIRKDCGLKSFVLAKGTVSKVTVEEAIVDLAALVPVEAGAGFDIWEYAEIQAELSAYAVRMRKGSHRTTGHRKTPHRDDVAKRFSCLMPGKTDPIRRHQRLNWEGFCPTLRAGTGPDRGSYQAVRPIHPSENRVITVREAARLQGFPDWFHFHPTVWHSFRMIGNSVSPIVSASILTGLVRDSI